MPLQLKAQDLPEHEAQQNQEHICLREAEEVA